MLTPYFASETDSIVVALGDMLSGYPSARASEMEAAARLDSLLRKLEAFPAWAIVKVCENIGRHGVWRDGKYDRQWPPSDPELIDAVGAQIRLYGDQHKSACDLLAAEVEK